jgi:DNA-binding transcriptional regulator YiaG
MTLTMSAIDTFESWGEDALRESWAEDIKASNLVQSLDDELRFTMNAFWHKSRKEFVMWTAEELSRRLGLTPRNTTLTLALMCRKRVAKPVGSPVDPMQRVYLLTDLGKDIARAALQREGVIEPYMSREEFKAARQEMRMTRSTVAEMFGMHVHSIMNYEMGRMAVPFAVAEKMKTKLRRSVALTSG